MPDRLDAMYTVGQLGRKFGLSRSTLLYYDRIGLLRPSARNRAGYRQYSEDDVRRLEQIRVYREAGLPLDQIRGSMTGSDEGLTAALEKRLVELNGDIRRLRNQQRLILGLLERWDLVSRVGVMNADRWVALLEAAGFDERDRHRWHVDFERTAPDRHQEFLEFLCLPDGDIRRIRGWSRQRQSN